MPNPDYKYVAVHPDIHRALKVEAFRRDIPITTLMREIVEAACPADRPPDDQTKKRAA